MKKSTREFIKEARSTEDYSFFDFIHGYFYMRWPYFYISMGKGDHPLSKKYSGFLGKILLFFEKFRRKNGNINDQNGFAEGYHGKVLPLESARQLVSIKKDIRVQNLEQVVPFSRARDIILKNPDHIAVIDCPCRKGMANPCKPIDVCLIVGEPFVSMVMEHLPKTSRLISSGEAQMILEQEADRGHVSHAFFKDAVLNRFYAICNCCSCCCGAMKAHQNGTPMIISSGFVSKIDDEKCILCGICTETCQFGALSIDEHLICDTALCMGCGVCVSHCAQGALSLERDETKPPPLEVEKLISISSQY
jgi:NAD-dependent dihydropyrimidine dehydrogenase PreA subunit